MQIITSTPQPKHEHLTADKTHQEDTPSTATTSHPMEPYSEIDLDQPTTSIANTFAKINMSPTQSPTQQMDEATTDQPTTKTLPIELWMRVFEHVDNTKHYARPPVVAVYKSCLITAARALPAFEKRSWKQSKGLSPHRPNQPRGSSQVEFLPAYAGRKQSAVARHAERG